MTATKNQVPRVKTPRQRSEDALQRAAADFLGRWGHESLIWTHVANERQGARAGARAKSMGQLAGWPDLTLLWPTISRTENYPNMLFIEFKVGENGLSPTQKTFRDRVTAMDLRYEIARSLEEFRYLLEKYGVPTANDRGWPRVWP